MEKSPTGGYFLPVMRFMGFPGCQVLLSFVCLFAVPFVQPNTYKNVKETLLKSVMQSKL